MYMAKLRESIDKNLGRKMDTVLKVI